MGQCMQIYERERVVAEHVKSNSLKRQKWVYQLSWYDKLTTIKNLKADIDQFGQRNVVPNSNLLGLRFFVFCICMIL